jgi:chorismate dehydratase
LVQIILGQRYGVRPRLVPLPLDADPETVKTDAVLLIGDRAMRACLPGFKHAYDLGQEWTDWTGLPFVYAVWAVREGIDVNEVEGPLSEAKEKGLNHVGEIAHREAPRLGLDAGFCRRYLTNIIHFDLGAKELEGLERFHQLALTGNLLKKSSRLECQPA